MKIPTTKIPNLGKIPNPGDQNLESKKSESGRFAQNLLRDFWIFRRNNSRPGFLGFPLGIFRFPFGIFLGWLNSHPNPWDFGIYILDFSGFSNLDFPEFRGFWDFALEIFSEFSNLESGIAGFFVGSPKIPFVSQHLSRKGSLWSFKFEILYALPDNSDALATSISIFWFAWGSVRRWGYWDGGILGHQRSITTRDSCFRGACYGSYNTFF